MVTGLSGVQFGLSSLRVNLFPRAMITYRIGRHEVLLQIYYKNYNFRKIRKAVVSRLKNCCY